MMIRSRKRWRRRWWRRITIDGDSDGDPVLFLDEGIRLKVLRLRSFCHQILFLLSLLLFLLELLFIEGVHGLFQFLARDDRDDHHENDGGDDPKDHEGHSLPDVIGGLSCKSCCQVLRKWSKIDIRHWQWHRPQERRNDVRPIWNSLESL